MPIHWNELFAESASPNEATADAISHQPALKCCAAAVSAVDGEVELLGIGSEPIDLYSDESGRQDSNLRPSGPKPDALPS